MEDFDLISYCSLFLKDKSLGDLVFYKENGICYSYEDLMLSVLSQAQKNTNNSSALKIHSSYQLFIHLLAGSMTKKELLILSDKEPESAVVNFQKQFNFYDVITDNHEEIKRTKEEAKIINFSHYSVDLNRSAFSILSSGSSGPSKSIGLSLNNIFHSAKSVIDFFSMTSSDSTFLNLPHHHIGGLMILWRAFFSQSLVTKNDDDKYSFISLVPLQLKRFLQDPEKLIKLKKCRGVLIGGAVLEVDLKTAALNHNIPIYETYGMSETASLVMLNGIPLKGQIVKLDSQNHFLIKGPTLCRQVPLDSEGFFQTKDIGVKNADGSFSFKQRSDLLFKSAGELIDPIAIESTLKSLSWIKMAVIVPITHSKWTNAACLIYQSSDESKNVTDIKIHLKALLHPHLIPKYFFKAAPGLFSEGIKPKRYEILQWAQEQYFLGLMNYQYFHKLNSKTLVVIFHGFMEDLNDMLAIVDKNMDSSFLLIDIPGHGKTNINYFENRDFIFSNFKNLIQFYLKEKKLIIYGYSMGGRIALELSALYLKPELLILESAHFGLETNELKTARLKADRKLLSSRDLDLKDFFSKWYKNPIFANYNLSSIYQDEIDKKLNFDSTQWQKSLEFFSPGASPLLQSETLNYVKNLKIFGIIGSEDLKYSDHYEQIKNLLPNFTLFKIHKAAHNPHKTHPKELKIILKSTLL